MTHTMRARTLTGLHDRMTYKLAFATREELDAYNSVDVQMHDVLATADSMEWTFDLKRLWLTEGRWPMMARQYLDPVAVDTWQETIGDRLTGSKRGIALLRTKTVKPRMSGRGMQRRWGSCMISFSYKAQPRPTLTLHSRTSYLGYIGALDLTMAWLLAERAAEATGRAVEDTKFVWYLEMGQYHGFKSLAYLLGDPTMREQLLDTDAYPSARHPGLKITRDWLRRIETMDGLHDKPLQPYGDMSYNTYRRVRRRYHTEVFGVDYAKQFDGGNAENPRDCLHYPPLPSLMADQLDLSCLRDADVTDGAELVDVPLQAEELG